MLFVTADSIDERVVAAIRELRASDQEVPVVVFYAGEDPHQEVRALDAGADDCIALRSGLHAEFQYIVARLETTMARLRRIKSGRGAAAGVEVDPLTHQAVIGNKRLSLSPMEFRFLLALRRRRGSVVPHQEMERIVWGEEGAASREALKHLARRVRLRLGPEARAINAVPGIGYILDGDRAPTVTSPSPE